jgi:hypothetical protein
MRFRFEALQSDGRLISGQVEADSPRGAYRDLLRRGVQPTTIAHARAWAGARRGGRPGGARALPIVAPTWMISHGMANRGANKVKIAETLEMAYPKKYVEQIIIGLEDPLNQHLVKLVAFEFPPELRRHFRREVKAWLDKIQRLRIKPYGRTGPAKFYYDLLFDFPFGDVEVPNMRTIMHFIAEEYDGAEPAKTPEEMVAWLQAFHAELAQRLHVGEAVLDMIPE